jgi:beta-lactamase class A
VDAFGRANRTAGTKHGTNRPLRVTFAALGLVVAGCSHSPKTVAARATTTPSTSTTSTTTSTTTTTTAPRATITAAPVSQLQAAVNRFAAGQSVPFDVVVHDFRTGNRASLRATRVVLSASLYKLFVSRELFRRIHEGQLSPDAPINDADGHTVAQCLDLMITVSSDECGVAGLNMVGKGNLDPSIHAQGYIGTYLASPQRTSAGDVALYFERLRDGSLLPEPELDTLRGYLERQQVNDRLPQGLPPGTKIAHKTGDRYGWAHDAGIVHAPTGDYLVVVLSGPWPGKCCYPNPPGEAPPAAFPAIAKLSTAVYDAVTSTSP